jgi:hypothetical protein
VLIPLLALAMIKPAESIFFSKTSCAENREALGEQPVSLCLQFFNALCGTSYHFMHLKHSYLLLIVARDLLHCRLFVHKIAVLLFPKRHCYSRNAPSPVHPTFLTFSLLHNTYSSFFFYSGF